MQTSLYERFMAVGSVKSLLTGEVYSAETERKAPEKDRTDNDASQQETTVRQIILR